MKVEIRKAIPGDEEVLAYIQTQAWKSAFADILSPEELDKYTKIVDVEKMYQQVLNNNFANGSILSIGGKAHCIAFWSVCRDRSEEGKSNQKAGCAELICIHSLNDNWGKGYGTIMMNHILAEIKEAGYVEVILWVFVANNRARKFYEKNVFIASKESKDTFGATEVMYYKFL